MLLITGGSGFIGMHAAKEYVDNGAEVAISQYRTRRDEGLLNEMFGGKVKVAQLDMTDGPGLQKTITNLGVTSILHLLAPPPGAWTPAEEYRANMMGLLSLLEAGEKLKLRRITIASSIAVYSGLPRGPFRESQRLPVPASNSTEAFKKAEEVLSSYYAGRTGMDVVIARLSGIYGPLYHSMQNFPSRVCHAAAKGQPLVTRTPAGQPSVYADDETDMCYVKDVVHGLRLVHDAPKLRARVYNLGAGVATRMGEVVAAAKQVVPSFSPRLEPGMRPGGRQRVYLDISRARRELGYEPRYDINKGVADYLAWLQKHPE